MTAHTTIAPTMAHTTVLISANNRGGAVSFVVAKGVRRSATTRPAMRRLEGKATAIVSANGAWISRVVKYSSVVKLYVKASKMTRQHRRIAPESEVATSRHCRALGANTALASAPTVKTITTDWAIE